MAQHVMMLLATLATHIKLSASVPPAPLLMKLLANAAPCKKQHRRWPKCPSHTSQCEKLLLSSSLLASTWPRPGYCSHLGDKNMGLPLCHFAFQITNKINLKGFVEKIEVKLILEQKVLERMYMTGLQKIHEKYIL